jgi:hypothetical protein
VQHCNVLTWTGAHWAHSFTCVFFISVALIIPVAQLAPSSIPPSPSTMISLSSSLIQTITLAPSVATVALVPMHGCPIHRESLKDSPSVVTLSLVCVTLPNSAAYVALQVPIPVPVIATAAERCLGDADREDCLHRFLLLHIMIYNALDCSEVCTSTPLFLPLLLDAPCLLSPASRMQPPLPPQGPQTQPIPVSPSDCVFYHSEDDDKPIGHCSPDAKAPSGKQLCWLLFVYLLMHCKLLSC